MIEAAFITFVVLGLALILWRTFQERLLVKRPTGDPIQVKALELKPGATLVIEVQRPVTKAELERLKAQVRLVHAARLMVLERGMTLSAVLNPGDTPPLPPAYFEKQFSAPRVVVDADAARAQRTDRRISKTERFNYPPAQ